eukprot:PhF_6_TR31728/c0_g1_i1/m.46692/K10770/ALKBH8; alkylated DNA repair protein alkB homolog 8
MFGVPGLEFYKDVLTSDEEKSLLAAIDDPSTATSWSNDLKRRTQHYGYKYNYSGKADKIQSDPIPTWAMETWNRCCGGGGGGTFREGKEFVLPTPDQLIVNEYLPGQGISAHVDHTGMFQDGIVSISLGSHCVFRFKEKKSTRGTTSGDNEEETNKKTVEVVVPRRSMLVLTGDARYNWTHEIVARKTDKDVGARGRRVSLTFRKMI